jgi:uncharacterized protein with ParB-like and HNH nuclease domain
MKASEQLLNNFLSQVKTQFIIPVYQRNYDWSLPQCSQLLADILEVGTKTNENHFIGSIVYMHDGIVTSAEVKPLVIIDGQQRLTTITLLILALQHFAARNNFNEKADELLETFLQNKYVKNESNKLKLKQSAANSWAFRHIIDGQHPDTFPEFSRVIENYRYFAGEISLGNFSTITEGLNRLLFVEVALERGKDDPQRIFESLNSTGLDLSQADLIRNYILMGLDPDKQEKVYNEHWSQIEIHARETELQENRVSDFIRDFLTLKAKKIPSKGKVYEEFKKRFRVRDEEFYASTLPQLKQYAVYYDKLLNPRRENVEAIQHELDNIKRLEIEVSYPFLLSVYSDYDTKRISVDVFLKILKLVQTLVWRRFIVNLPTNALGQIFMNLYSEIDETNYVESIEYALARKKGTRRFPNDKEISEAFHEKDFYNIQKKNRDYFFSKLENHNTREMVILPHPEMTIEHIFPQTPDPAWESELSQSEFALLKEKYLNTIGNLTLVGYNSSLSNKSYAEKKVLPDKGYNFSKLWLNEYLKSTDKWSVDAVKNRSNLMLQRFFAIWPFPQTEVDEDFDWDEDFTLYDAPDPKFRKLDYFIFRDEKVEVETITEMYVAVMRRLLEENPSLFLSQDIRNIISIGNDKSQMRYGAPLSGNYYLETHGSSTEKLKRLLLVLERFGCAEDLLINFSNDVTADVQRDRTYWEHKTSPGIMSIVDQLFTIVNRLTPEAVKNYNSSYVGVSINGAAQNYVVFAPKQEYIRVEVLSRNIDATIGKIKAAGLHIVGVGKYSRRIRFRLGPGQFEHNQKLLNELCEEARTRYFG